MQALNKAYVMRVAADKSVVEVREISLNSIHRYLREGWKRSSWDEYREFSAQLAEDARAAKGSTDIDPGDPDPDPDPGAGKPDPVETKGGKKGAAGK